MDCLRSTNKGSFVPLIIYDPLELFKGRNSNWAEEMEGEGKKNKNKELKPFHLQRGEGSGCKQWPQMPAERTVLRHGGSHPAAAGRAQEGSAGPGAARPPSRGCCAPSDLRDAGHRAHAHCQHRCFIIVVVIPVTWPVSCRHTRQKQ